MGQQQICMQGAERPYFIKQDILLRVYFGYSYKSRVGYIRSQCYQEDGSSTGNDDLSLAYTASVCCKFFCNLATTVANAPATITNNKQNI